MSDRPGNGTTTHLSLELLKREAGVNLIHVPYRSTGAGLPDLLSGQVDAAFGDVSVMTPQVVANSLVGLAITSQERSALLPDLVTTAEAGYPTLVVENIYGLVTRAGVPADVLKRLEVGGADGAGRSGLPRRPGEAWRRRCPRPRPRNTARCLRSETERWGPIARAAGLKVGIGSPPMSPRAATRSKVDFSRTAVARYIQLASLFRRRIEFGLWAAGPADPDRRRARRRMRRRPRHHPAGARHPRGRAPDRALPRQGHVRARAPAGPDLVRGRDRLERPPDVAQGRGDRGALGRARPAAAARSASDRRAGAVLSPRCAAAIRVSARRSCSPSSTSTSG